MSNSTGAPTSIRARQLVSERLALIREQLPRGLNPQMGPITSIMGEIMLVALTSDGRASPMDVREIADFVMRPQLLALSGVAQVIPIGGEVRQYRVTPNVATMQALDVTHEQIEQAITRFGTNTGGGFVDQSGREYLIRNVGLTKRLEDLANTVVIYRNNQPILLKQVATVEFAARVKRGDAGYQGEPAVIIGIQKQPNADTVSLTRKVEAALERDSEDPAAGRDRDQHPVPAGDLHRDLDRQRPARAGRGRRRGRDRAVRVPDERPRHRDLARRDPDLDPDHGAGVPRLRSHHQHHDARRAGDRDRRAGRRRRGGRREHPAAAAAEQRACRTRGR